VFLLLSDRQTDRQTDRQKERKTVSETDRHIDKEKWKEETETDKNLRDSQIGSWSQKNRRRGKHKSRQLLTGIQTMRERKKGWREGRERGERQREIIT